MATSGLTQEQKCKYEKDGCLVIEDVFDPTKLKQISDVAEELFQRSDANTTKPYERGVFLPSTMHPTFCEILHHDKLLNIVSDLIGPSFRCIQHDWLCMAMPESGNRRLKWHQDWSFWPHTNQSLVTGFLSIDESVRENGCLQVVPGSHKGPLYNHFIEDKFASEITDATFDPSRGVHVEVPSGGISVLHPFTVHSITANQSNHTRRFLVFSFAATDSWPLLGVVGKGREICGPVDWDRYCSTVVRGKASQFPRMEALPVSLPVSLASGSSV